MIENKNKIEKERLNQNQQTNLEPSNDEIYLEDQAHQLLLDIKNGGDILENSFLLDLLKEHLRSSPYSNSSVTTTTPAAVETLVEGGADYDEIESYIQDGSNFTKTKKVDPLEVEFNISLEKDLTLKIKNPLKPLERESNFEEVRQIIDKRFEQEAIGTEELLEEFNFKFNSSDRLLEEDEYLNSCYPPYFFDTKAGYVKVDLVDKEIEDENSSNNDNNNSNNDANSNNNNNNNNNNDDDNHNDDNSNSDNDNNNIFLKRFNIYLKRVLETGEEVWETIPKKRKKVNSKIKLKISQKKDERDKDDKKGEEDGYEENPHPFAGKIQLTMQKLFEAIYPEKHKSLRRSFYYPEELNQFSHGVMKRLFYITHLMNFKDVFNFIPELSNDDPLVKILNHYSDPMAPPYTSQFKRSNGLGHCKSAIRACRNIGLNSETKNLFAEAYLRIGMAPNGKTKATFDCAVQIVLDKEGNIFITSRPYITLANDILRAIELYITSYIHEKWKIVITTREQRFSYLKKLFFGVASRGSILSFTRDTSASLIACLWSAILKIEKEKIRDFKDFKIEEGEIPNEIPPSFDFHFAETYSLRDFLGDMDGKAKGKTKIVTEKERVDFFREHFLWLEPNIFYRKVDLFNEDKGTNRNQRIKNFYIENFFEQDTEGKALYRLNEVGKLILFGNKSSKELGTLEEIKQNSDKLKNSSDIKKNFSLIDDPETGAPAFIRLKDKIFPHITYPIKDFDAQQIKKAIRDGYIFTYEKNYFKLSPKGAQELGIRYPISEAEKEVIRIFSLFEEEDKKIISEAEFNLIANNDTFKNEALNKRLIEWNGGGVNRELKLTQMMKQVYAIKPDFNNLKAKTYKLAIGQGLKKKEEIIQKGDQSQKNQDGQNSLEKKIASNSLIKTKETQKTVVSIPNRKISLSFSTIENKKEEGGEEGK